MPLYLLAVVICSVNKRCSSDIKYSVSLDGPGQSNVLSRLRPRCRAFLCF